jgi:hypothetical protein
MNPEPFAPKNSLPFEDDRAGTGRKDALDQVTPSVPPCVQAIDLLQSLQHALKGMVSNGPFQSGLFGEGHAVNRSRTL